MSVPRLPPLLALTTPGASRTRTGDPVIGSAQWYLYAQQMQWLLGAGSTLVTAGPEPDDLAPGSSYVFRYYAWPHTQNTYRVWVLSLGCNDEDGSSGVIKDITGTTTLQTFTVPGYPEPRRGRVLATVLAVENVTSPSTGEVGFTLDVDSGAADSVVVNGVVCYEVPLVASGTEADTLQSGQPIYHSDAVTPISLRAVQIGADFAVADARRACLFSFFRLTSSSISSATFTPWAASTIPVLARRRYSADGAGNRQIAVAVLGDGTGEVRISASSGDSVTLAFTSTKEWKTGVLDIDAEDPAELATDGGLQSGVRDMLTVEWRSIVPFTDELQVFGVCGGEVD